VGRAIKKVALALFLFLAGFSMLAGGLYLWYTRPGEGKGAPATVLAACAGLTPLCGVAYHCRHRCMQLLSTLACIAAFTTAVLTPMRTPPQHTRTHATAATALLILGSICFLPGAYHTRVAYLAWRGVEGYSLNSIPDV